MRFNDNGIEANNFVANADLTLAGATTLTINGDTGADNLVVTHRGGYPQWGHPAIVPSTVTITNGTPIDINLDGTSVGAYYVLTTDGGAGTSVANFVNADGFNIGDSFYVKNVDKTNGASITLTFNGVEAICNSVLTPPTLVANSVLCVGYYDGTDLFIY